MEKTAKIMNEKIIIIGCGGFGREVKTLIDQINKIKKTFELIGFIDDNKNSPNNINGLPYLGCIDILQLSQYKGVSLCFGIGDPMTKFKIYEGLKNEDFRFPTLIHPKAIISEDYVRIGKGCIITAGVIITCNINIEDFVTLNLSCTVGHDTTIKNFSSFMPSVNISGEVIIHERVYVGTGAKIINQLEIGKETIVGAGAVVAKSLPEKCTAVGIPAKPIKFHE